MLRSASSSELRARAGDARATDGGRGRGDVDGVVIEASSARVRIARRERGRRRGKNSFHSFPVKDVSRQGSELARGDSGTRERR